MTKNSISELYATVGRQQKQIDQLAQAIDFLCYAHRRSAFVITDDHAADNVRELAKLAQQLAASVDPRLTEEEDEE